MLRSQNVISSTEHGGRRKLPYVFTEQGVAMLSAVLHSQTAVKISIQIMQAFVQMRQFIAENAAIFKRLDMVERKQLEADEKFDRLFDALQNKQLTPKQGIFFDGQVFDAYTFVSDLIRSGKSSLVLIDNYVDDSMLTLLTKRKKGVKASIYTGKISKQLALDLKKHNAQYPSVEVKALKNVHDRFLLIDHKELYHFGASLKDLGKKWFAFSKLEFGAIEIINKLNQ
ncbi:MAG: ORF6N domain-containing protein [Bacteroidales bacterium]|nr:ORF6N domain-containing protein [Bacteroidales bacterium]